MLGVAVKHCHRSRNVEAADATVMSLFVTCSAHRGPAGTDLDCTPTSITIPAPAFSTSVATLAVLMTVLVYQGVYPEAYVFAKCFIIGTFHCQSVIDT